MATAARREMPVGQCFRPIRLVRMERRLMANTSHLKCPSLSVFAPIRLASDGSKVDGNSAPHSKCPSPSVFAPIRLARMEPQG